MDTGAAKFSNFLYQQALAGSSLSGQSSQGVAVNDMILAINGKLTSGMTTIAFDVELELSGQSMLLTVSRYKSPKRVIESLVHKEREVLSKLNDLSKEEQHLGWIEYAGGKGKGEYPPADISVASGESNGVSRLGDESHADGNESILGPSVDENSRGQEARPFQHGPDGLIGARSKTGSKPPQQSTVMAKIAGQGKGVTNETANVNQEDPRNASSPRKAKQSSPSRSKSITPRLSNRTLDEASLAVVKRTMPPRKSRAEDLPDSSNDSSALEEEWSDDGNAWLGCVCSLVHDEETKVFWIQCDRCQSWYNAAEECVGMSKKEVADAREWLCWACGPAPESVASGRGHDSPKERSLQAYNRREAEDSKDNTSTKESDDQTLSVNAVDTSQESPPEPKFKQGDIVYVEEHAWPGVNNSEGVATVLVAYTDADGDGVYDVKYVVGGKTKGILEKYLSRHHF